MTKYCPHCGSLLEETKEIESEADFFQRFQEYIDEMNNLSEQIEMIKEYSRRIDFDEHKKFSKLLRIR